ncbi:hypothetical protein AURDEDRAFT_164465 [Auricularia subglabra TFB-10046 SS5]|nr:hypothetical protein AURDEDRAFT_164465 [Auricularia subglabra TFB-10046 SS5]
MFEEFSSEYMKADLFLWARIINPSCGSVAEQLIVYGETWDSLCSHRRLEAQNLLRGVKAAFLFIQELRALRMVRFVARHRLLLAVATRSAGAHIATYARLNFAVMLVAIARPEVLPSGRLPEVMPCSSPPSRNIVSPRVEYPALHPLLVPLGGAASEKYYLRVVARAILDILENPLETRRTTPGAFGFLPQIIPTFAGVISKSGVRYQRFPLQQLAIFVGSSAPTIHVRVVRTLCTPPDQLSQDSDAYLKASTPDRPNLCHEDFGSAQYQGSAICAVLESMGDQAVLVRALEEFILNFGDDAQDQPAYPLVVEDSRLGGAL